MTTPVPLRYFAIGPSLATLVNTEISLDRAPNVKAPSSRIPLTGPKRNAALDSSVNRAGKVNVDMRFDTMLLPTLMTYIPALWGDFTTASLPLFASWLDTSQHYSPFAVVLESPREGEHYDVGDATWLTNVRIPGLNWVLLSRSVSADTTLTTSDRLVLADTSAAAVTLALPPASTPQPYTVFSVVVDVAGHNLVLNPDGSETIDGASTKTISALKQRVDYYSDGAAWYTISY